MERELANNLEIFKDKNKSSKRLFVIIILWETK